MTNICTYTTTSNSTTSFDIGTSYWTTWITNSSPSGPDYYASSYIEEAEQKVKRLGMFRIKTEKFLSLPYEDYDEMWEQAKEMAHNAPGSTITIERWEDEKWVIDCYCEATNAVQD